MQTSSRSVHFVHVPYDRRGMALHVIAHRAHSATTVLLATLQRACWLTAICVRYSGVAGVFVPNTFVNVAMLIYVKLCHRSLK